MGKPTSRTIDCGGCANCDPATVCLALLLYLTYLLIELPQLILVLYYCEERRKVLTIGVVAPLMPF